MNEPLSSLSSTEILALWVNKQFDDIERSTRLISIAFDICKLTSPSSFVDESSILLFIDAMQNVNFIEEFEVDTNVIGSMSLSHNNNSNISKDHQYLVQGSIEILDHMENLTFLLFDLIEIIIGYKLTGEELSFVINEVMQASYGSYVINNIFPAYDIYWMYTGTLTKDFLYTDINNDQNIEQNNIDKNYNSNNTINKVLINTNEKTSSPNASTVWSLLEVITIKNQTTDNPISIGTSKMYSYIEDIFDKGIFPTMSTLKYGMQAAVYENDAEKALKIINISKAKKKYDQFLWTSAAQLFEKKGLIKEEDKLRIEINSRP
jgi:hypothetical protein